MSWAGATAFGEFPRDVAVRLESPSVGDVIMGRSRITVGLSNHRVENLPAAETAMEGHGIVALEEPPTEGFAAMLAGRLTIEAHLEDLAPEFPEYSRRQCELLRRRHQVGVRIVQVEPFLAALETIHARFEAGGRPQEVEADPTLGPVYRAEKRWFSALLAYYVASAGPDLDRAVEAVCTFARVDAERGQVRDAMRARELVTYLDSSRRLYVEAGPLHLGLVEQLRRRAPEGVSVEPRWLSAGQEALEAAPPPPAPGDQLTLAFARGDGPDRDQARLLAARSLIQAAMTIKEEMAPTPENPYPHARDDAESGRLVGYLRYEDCRRLLPAVRSRPPLAARAEVERYLEERPTSRV
jgi:hypothetical protein